MTTRLLPAVAVAVLLPFYWLAFRESVVGPWNDDGLYAASAQSLSEGKGYRIPSLPGDPPQTKYPILFPAALAVIWKAFPEFPANTWALKLVPLLATAGWLFASRHLLARLGHPATGTWAAILTAAAPLTITLSTSLLADTLFALLVTLAVIRGHDAATTSSVGLREAFVAALVAALAYHTKTTGIAAIVSILLVLGARRKWRACLCFGIVAASLCLPWVWWQQSQGGAPGDIYNSWQNYRDWQVLFNFTVYEKAEIIGTNALLLLRPPVLPLSLTPAALMACSLAFTGFVVLGFIIDRRLTVAHVFFLLYTAMMLLWAWSPTRFSSALLPLALYFAAAGIRRVFRAPRACGVATAALLSVALGGLAVQTAASSAAGVPPMDDFHRGLDWKSMIAAAQRAGCLTGPDAVILASADPAVWLYGKRKALREMDLYSPLELIYSRRPDPEQPRWRAFAAYLSRKRITHIIDGPVTGELGGMRRDCMRILERERPGALGPAVDLGAGFKLWPVNPGKL